MLRKVTKELMKEAFEELIANRDTAINDTIKKNCKKMLEFEEEIRKNFPGAWKLYREIESITSENIAEYIEHTYNLTNELRDCYENIEKLTSLTENVEVGEVA